MKNLPIVNKEDRRIGAISALFVLIVSFIILNLLSYTIADPRPKDIVLKVEALPEIILRNLTLEGGGSGNPTNAPKTNKVTPQTTKTIRDKNSKSESEDVQGESNHSNQNKSSENKASTTVYSEFSFKPGGSGNGSEGGEGKGFGKDNGSGAGPGDGDGKKPRVRLNDPNNNNISSDQSCSVSLKLTINGEGAVIKAENLVSKTSTTNQIVINQVIANVRSQVRYNKKEGASAEIVYLTINLSAR